MTMARTSLGFLGTADRSEAASSTDTRIFFIAVSSLGYHGRPRELAGDGGQNDETETRKNALRFPCLCNRQLTPVSAAKPIPVAVMAPFRSHVMRVAPRRADPPSLGPIPNSPAGVPVGVGPNEAGAGRDADRAVIPRGRRSGPGIISAAVIAAAARPQYSGAQQERSSEQFLFHLLNLLFLERAAALARCEPERPFMLGSF